MHKIEVLTLIIGAVMVLTGTIILSTIALRGHELAIGAIIALLSQGTGYFLRGRMQQANG